jgi:RNA polymerase sigma-70 factor (ECF subfamily)
LDQSNQDNSLIFEKELFPHLEALKTFAFHLTYDDSTAEDLVQETYLKAHKFIDRYVSGTNGKAWLFKILKNAYINEYRKKSKSPKTVDYDGVLIWQDNENMPTKGYGDLRQDLFDERMGDEVTIALNALPLDFRTVILLCDVEGFTYEEIAKILDLPIGTVRSRLFRARNMLKELLRSYAERQGYKDFRGLRNKDYNDEEE